MVLKSLKSAYPESLVSFVHVQDMDTGFEMVRGGKLDLYFGGISITSQREASGINFIQEINTKKALVTRHTYWGDVMHRFSRIFFTSIDLGSIMWLGALGVALAFFVRLLYRLRSNEEYEKSLFWDTAVLAAVCYLFCIMLASTMGTYLEYEINFDEVNSGDDLYQIKVVTVSGTSTVPYTAKWGAIVETADTLEAAWDRYDEDPSIAYLIHDEIAVRNYIETHGGDYRIMAYLGFDPYGFAVREGNYKFQERVNQARLETFAEPDIELGYNRVLRRD